MKVLLTALAILMALDGCVSKKKDEPMAVNILVDRDKSAKAYPYRGGLFKVWVGLSDVRDIADVRWKTGKADIAYRNSTTEDGEIVGDTVYLHWESLPKEWVKIDTMKTDSSGVFAYDTTIRYLDSIGVVVDGEESDLEVVEIHNILPRIDSLGLEGIRQEGDSVLTLAVHPGESIEIEMLFSDAFNLDYPVQEVRWPEGIGNFISKRKSDSLWSWTWEVPNELVDTVLPLILTDKGGYGTREYRLEVVVYGEAGSAWVVSGSDLVKFSPGGREVVRVKGSFSEVSDLVLNSNSAIQNKVWVADLGKGEISKYDAFGRLLWKDKGSFNTPYSIALDVEASLVWVSSLDTIAGDVLYSRVQRYKVTEGDSASIEPIGASYRVAGAVKGLSVDQFERGLVWFVSPEEDFVGFIRGGATEAVVFRDSVYQFNRPSVVSYDPTRGKAWIADSSRVVVIDTSGNVQATITGFKFANSISAASGVCWISDAMAGKVYKFDIEDVSGRVQASSGLIYDELIAPWSVSTSSVDRSVWIADKEAGRVIRLDEDGNEIATGSGLTLPTLIRVHQVIE